MLDKVKQLMELKKQADQLKKELEAVKVDFNDVRGIKIVINGAQMFQSLEIEDSWLNPQNKNRFQTELLRAVNMAIKKSQQTAATKMKGMTGLNIPGL